MRWYNHKIYRAHQDDIWSLEERLKGSYDIKNVEHIFRFIKDVAYTFNRAYSATGVLDLSDLIQEGYAELLYAWTKLDWHDIESSPNPQGQLWSYLKLSVRRGIVRAVMDYRGTIRIPRDYYSVSKEKHSGYEYQTDIFLSTTFTQMFGDAYFDAIDDISDWDNDRLNDFLNELMDKIMTFKEKDILKKMFGMDEPLDKKVPVKEIAKWYHMSERGVKKSKQRSLFRMIKNKHIIENFLRD